MLTITQAQIDDVTLGIIDITWNGLAMPLVDRESEIQVNFSEVLVAFGAAGNITELGAFRTSENIPLILVPTIQSGVDYWGFLTGETGNTQTSGGAAPSKVVPKPLVVTTINGVLTIFKTAPIKETTVSYIDTGVTKPSMPFRAFADISREAGKQLWQFVGA